LTKAVLWRASKGFVRLIDSETICAASSSAGTGDDLVSLSAKHHFCCWIAPGTAKGRDGRYP